MRYARGPIGPTFDTSPPASRDARREESARTQRCKDARAEGTLAAAEWPAAVYHRPGPLRPAGAVGAGQSPGRPQPVERSAGGAPAAAVVVGVVHEGVWAGGGGPPAVAARAVDVPVAAALRAPADDLRPGVGAA